MASIARGRASRCLALFPSHLRSGPGVSLGLVDLPQAWGGSSGPRPSVRAPTADACVSGIEAEAFKSDGQSARASSSHRIHIDGLRRTTLDAPGVGSFAATGLRSLDPGAALRRDFWASVADSAQHQGDLRISAEVPDASAGASGESQSDSTSSVSVQALGEDEDDPIIPRPRAPPPPLSEAPAGEREEGTGNGGQGGKSEGGGKEGASEDGKDGEGKGPFPEVGGPKGPEPTRFGDWEKNGRCYDF